MNYRIALWLLTIFSLLSCEEYDTRESSELIASKITGNWSVDEHSNMFKAALQGYTAYIRTSENSATTIIISDFYGLGDNIDAIATVNGYHITLNPNQILKGGYNITSGSGEIEENFTEINWTFNIDDGSGELDEVKAQYSFLY